MQRVWMTCVLLLLGSSLLAAPPVRLMRESDEQQIRAMLPTVDDDYVHTLLKSDDLMWYTEREMPKAYEHAHTFHSPYHNIAAFPDGRVPNSNDFPWAEAGGAHDVRGLEVFRFMQLPKDSNGRYKPIVYWEERAPGDSFDPMSWMWVYPEGTVFGELMTMTGPDQHLYPYELRLRYREDASWEVDVFRPFPTSGSLSKRIKELRPNWQAQPDLRALVAQCDTRLQFAKVRLADNNRNVQAFNSLAGAHPLPPIRDKALVKELLTSTVWSTAVGQTWQVGSNGVEVTAPTVNRGGGFHIVPEQYKGHAIKTDSHGCMECHKHTNVGVRLFDQNREWYGRVRGSDGIISFHPIAPRAISNNGFRPAVQFRPEFLRAGILEPYSPSRHFKAGYRKSRSFLHR